MSGLSRDAISFHIMMKFKKPPLRIQPTTLWDYPSQDYGEVQQGIPGYKGATPSYIIWNLLQRYTKPGDLVIDPCAGSGTTLDVARDLDRRALGYDLAPTRKDIFRVDARKLPLEDEKADLVFIDPPYSTHINYSEDPRCIGKLDVSSGSNAYYEAMDKVLGEIHRVLRPGRHMALYVSDSFVKGNGFFPIGFELFSLMRKRFEPVDIVAVVRHNATLNMGNYRAAAEEGNFFLRGFNYLFIMKKAGASKAGNIRQASQATPRQRSEHRPPHSPPRSAASRPNRSFIGDNRKHNRPR
ncbi:MAG: hypothetical protein IT444_11945 [Phycisphaeraceae bacterium]|nr:hypothetical protein [Phycisphaeraceae bacterium]